VTPPLRFRWTDAIRDSNLPPSVRYVALTLATWMNGNGFARPAKQTILAGTGYTSLRTIDGAIDCLEHEGFLHVERSKGRLPNRYWARLPNSAASAPLEADATAQEMQGLSTTNPAPDDAQPRTSQHSTPHLTTRNPAPGAPEPKSEASGTQPEPSRARAREDESELAGLARRSQEHGHGSGTGSKTKNLEQLAAGVLGDVDAPEVRR
jgi:hypothetical protein